MNSMSSLTAEQLRRAAAIKEQIDSLENELGKILGGAAVSGNGKRVMSASARARIGAAQKARWAKVKGNGNAGKTTRRKMSAAARAKIAAAAKARWAKAKAAGRKSL
jgi:hypothetical protein